MVVTGMDEGAPRYRYYADFSAPGFLETMSFWAKDHDDAERQARLHADMPWKEWPRLCSKVDITVTASWDAIILPGGETLPRGEFERRQADAHRLRA